MSRNYSLPHSLPKDAGAQKQIALPDINTSQLDFAMLKGIGASTISSYVLAHVGVAVHTQGSKVESEHPLVTTGGVFLDYSATQSSPVAGGRARIQRMSAWGENYAVPYPPTASKITAGSVNIIKSSSGVVYEFGVAWNNANVGNTVSLSNNLTSVRTIVFSAASGNYHARLPVGGIPIGTSIKIQRTVTGGGGASVFISYL